MTETHLFPRYTLAFMVVLGDLLLLAAMLVLPVPPDNKDIVNIGLGVVLSWSGIIINYEFGAARKQGTQAVTVENTSSDPVPVEAS